MVPGADIGPLLQRQRRARLDPAGRAARASRRDHDRAGQSGSFARSLGEHGRMRRASAGRRDAPAPRLSSRSSASCPSRGSGGRRRSRWTTPPASSEQPEKRGSRPPGSAVMGELTRRRSSRTRPGCSSPRRNRTSCRRSPYRTSAARASTPSRSSRRWPRKRRGRGAGRRPSPPRGSFSPASVSTPRTTTSTTARASPLRTASRRPTSSPSCGRWTPRRPALGSRDACRPPASRGSTLQRTLREAADGRPRRGQDRNDQRRLDPGRLRPRHSGKTYAFAILLNGGRVNEFSGHAYQDRLIRALVKNG